ncbi:MAG TPA: carboxymuconolactone decarboxylase family protein [Chthoniobacterales bacterium]|nr:carboxymuconolactone decarboxylase family protein [Chthoniobacterales bacterium]
MNNEPRLAYWKASPAAVRAMYALEKAASSTGLEPSLYELVKMRVSQINGCAFCVDMHTRDARKLGETDDRLALVCVWPEATCFTPRERAALRWTEALTRLAGGHVTEEDYAAVSAEFSEEERVNLTLAIVTINGWNRFGVGFRVPPGYSFA